LADPKEMPRLLARKLVEESNEVLENEMLDESTFPGSGQKVARRIQELADVAEVLTAIHEFHDIDDNLFERECDTKLRIHGGFLKGVVADMPDKRVETQLRTLVEDCLRVLHLSATGVAEQAYLREQTKLLFARADVLGCLGKLS